MLLEVRLTFEMRRPDGKLGHTEVCIADSVVMLSESQTGRFQTMLHLYVSNVDESYERIIRAGVRALVHLRIFQMGIDAVE